MIVQEKRVVNMSRLHSVGFSSMCPQIHAIQNLTHEAVKTLSANIKNEKRRFREVSYLPRIIEISKDNHARVVENIRTKILNYSVPFIPRTVLFSSNCCNKFAHW